MMHLLARLARSCSAIEPNRHLGAERQVLLTPRLIRQLLILHVVVLVLVRVLRDADDFSDWELIPFLNANAFASLWQLLQRRELHFRNPFDFSMNVGAESVPSAVLFRGLGHISLYWSNVFLLLIYDAVFFGLVYWLFAVLFADGFPECVAWSLIAMSPIILTYASTSAFNMQGYFVVVLGLVGCEYFLRKQPIVGTLLLAVAFCAMPQGYPLALFLPYYVICWVVLRAVLAHPRLGTTEPQVPHGIGAGWVAMCLGTVLGLVTIVEYWSRRTYITAISPLAPYGPYGAVPPGQWSGLGERAVLFLRQSFVPIYKVDGVPVGFAPYFIYVTVITVAALAVWRRSAERPACPTRLRSSGLSRSLLRATVVVGAILFGYLPGFLSSIVKSQRAVFGDLFLTILAAHWIASIKERRLLRPNTIVIVLALVLCASDAYYSYFTLSVNHFTNHSPVFDFDLADGIARHDLVAAIGVMREQIEHENTALVIYWPDCYNENNHTDPAVFFARFLRHFGRYGRRPGLIFPCRWCEVKYGCPFPGVRDRECSGSCCYNDPLFEIRSQRRAGKRVLLWWWREPREVRDQARWSGAEDLASDWPERLLRRLARRYALVRIELAQAVGSGVELPHAAASGWVCYELVERVNLPSALPMTIPRTRRRAIKIESATYGSTCTGAGETAKGNRTAQVAAACNRKTRCDYLVDNRDGDPFPGCPKDFEVTWRCGTDPSPRNTSYPAVALEGYTVTLTCE